MKIKSITEKIDLCREEGGLCLISEKKVLVEGFTDVGIVSNGLIPIIYFKDKKFAYLDEETFEIYEINNVDWISGLHYVGNNLSYLGHNYRTDPIKNLTDSYQFKTIEKVTYSKEKFPITLCSISINSFSCKSFISNSWLILYRMVNTWLLLKTVLCFVINSSNS